MANDMKNNNNNSSISNKLTQMFNDDEIMKRKLMIDGDGIGDDRKISSLIKQFIVWCYNNNDNEYEDELSAERLLNAIDQSELAMAKSVQTIKMITHELDNYENIYKNIEKSITDAKEKLFTCKIELANAKQIRQYKIEYDSIANIIDQHPSTQETQIKLNKLENEIQTLQNINNQIESKLEKRRRQFKALLTTTHQLQSTLDEENNNDNNNDNIHDTNNNNNDDNIQTNIDTLSNIHNDNNNNNNDLLQNLSKSFDDSLDEDTIIDQKSFDESSTAASDTATPQQSTESSNIIIPLETN